MNSKKYSLGIDIGTTSVKVCIYDSETDKILSKQSKDTQANVPSQMGSEADKQDVPKIISALHSCVSRLPKDLLKQIKVIGVCGQMHGVMLWSNTTEGFCWDRTESPGTNSGVKFEVIRSRVSDLYTWQDTRCDSAFLQSLPHPESHVQIHTGFGCATLFWLSRNCPEKLTKFNCSGTIQDFVVALLCNLQSPVMSSQNAAAWGYYNTTSNTWNMNILEKANFPVHLLPKVVKPNELVGTLPESWFGIPSGTPVGVALGDFQCSVMATLKHENEAVLNISTSAQIAYLMAPSFEPNPSPIPPPLTYFVYFNGRYLAVGASLNGGNVLATFVKMLQQWTLDLGFSVPQSKVWEKVTELGDKSEGGSSLVIVPTLLGERHIPEQNASVTNLDHSNLGLGQIFRALCSGLVKNLQGMIPKDQLIASKIVKIIGSGSALIRNKVLQKEVAAQYQLPVEFVGGRGACVGAAMAVNPPTN
ncbi:hypothetical protein RUM44_007939 [Polyplax serrata]|uniref:Carbohydrate kinase FGGY N-terminal domain-containing protein n=1 Tax=Polyplax serrata TaxID=468196 RepID=A0ABR1BB08_POLSC